MIEEASGNRGLFFFPSRLLWEAISSLTTNPPRRGGLGSKAWVCSGPDRRFNLNIRNGDVHLNEPVLDGLERDQSSNSLNVIFMGGEAGASRSSPNEPQAANCWPPATQMVQVPRCRSSYAERAQQARPYKPPSQCARSSRSSSAPALRAVCCR
jgi:hypothetical protein